MALLPGSYARLAGLQSETNKRTVTRVASNEVQYRRCLDSYRKNMWVNINYIKREERNLRRSLKRYSRVLKDHKLEQSRRFQQEAGDLMYSYDVKDDTTGSPQGHPSPGQGRSSRGHLFPDIGNVGNNTVRRKDSCTIGLSNALISQLQTGLKLAPECKHDAIGTESITPSTAGISNMTSNGCYQSSDSFNDFDKPKFSKRRLSLSTFQNHVSTLDSQISEMSRSQPQGPRVPDTRDNFYFRGHHGQELSSVSANLIRTAAIIYPIKHGYDSKPSSSAPTTSARLVPRNKQSRKYWESIRTSLRADKKTKSRLLSTKSMLCFPHLVQEITKLKAAGKLQNGFQNAHVASVKRQEDEVVTSSKMDDCSSSLLGAWNGQVTWHARPNRRKNFRSGDPSMNGTYSHTMQSRKLKNGETVSRSTKVAWQSALQKLRLVHTLS